MRYLMTAVLVMVALLVGGVQAEAQWSTGYMEDRMARTSDDVYAISGWVGPHKRMNRYPADLHGSLRVNCRRLHIIFSDTAWPRYRSFVRVQVDGGRVHRFTQGKTDNMLRLDLASNDLLNELRDGNSVSVAVDWIDEGILRFDFSLGGSRDAIDRSCADARDLSEWRADKQRMLTRTQRDNMRLAEKRELRRQANEFCEAELMDINHPEYDACFRSKRNELYTAAGHGTPQ